MVIIVILFFLNKVKLDQIHRLHVLFYFWLLNNLFSKKKIKNNIYKVIFYYVLKLDPNPY